MRAIRWQIKREPSKWVSVHLISGKKIKYRKQGTRQKINNENNQIQNIRYRLEKIKHAWTAGLTHTRAQAHTCTHTHMRTHTQIQAHACTNTRTHVHTHTRTNTHTRTHTHTHTHTRRTTMIKYCKSSRFCVILLW